MKAVAVLSLLAAVAFSDFAQGAQQSYPARTVRIIAPFAPGGGSDASSGPGAPAHLAAELFQAAAKVKMTHVAYKGTGPGLTSVVAGETDLMSATCSV